MCYSSKLERTIKSTCLGQKKESNSEIIIISKSGKRNFVMKIFHKSTLNAWQMDYEGES